MKKQFRLAAAVLAALSVLSVSGCAISAALEEENGFKFNSSQVSVEADPNNITYNTVNTPSMFKNIASPTIFSTYNGTPYETVEGDLWVSPDGSDETGDGSKEKPYATFAKAQSAVREIKAAGKLPKGTFTVVFMPGEYRLTEGIKFTAEDSGTEDCRIIYAAYDSRDVVFKGSVALNGAELTPVGDDIKAILPDASKDKVMMLDLKKYGVTPEQLRIYKIGNNGWMEKYDSYYVGGNNVKIMFDREAMTLARYPNDGEMLRANGIENVGDSDTQTPAVFKMRSETAEHVRNWHSFEDIWCVGVFYGDWSTISSKVSFDFTTNNVTYDLNCFSNGRISPSSKSPYMFYNVLDELDVPGEYYLDRENCILYMYPNSDPADAEIELITTFTDTMLSGDYLENITFMGFTFLGTQGSGMLCYDCENVVLDRCKFYGIGGEWACQLGGHNCKVIECEAHYLSFEGIAVGGGDKDVYDYGNSVLENCYVTHWALEGLTGPKALGLWGCGNAMRNCEAAYSTGSAASIWHAESVFEYNIFHDCTTWATDMGALYYGDSIMGAPNLVVRYNIFYNIGSDYARPCALYWDHGHGNQRAYGNLIVNIAGDGIFAGGGRNNTIVGNIIVNTGEDALYYNEVMYDSFHEGHSDPYFRNHYLYTPHTTPWHEAIAYLQFITLEESDPGDPYLLYNPAMSHISDNIILNEDASIGNIFPQVWQFSIIRDNYVRKLDNGNLNSIFVDAANGDYRVKEDAAVRDYAIGFKDIPYHLIGRY